MQKIKNMNENDIVTSQINTSAFADSIIPPTTHVDGLNKTSLPTTNVQVAQFKNPEVINYARAARYDADGQMMSFGQKSADNIVKSMFPNMGKIDTTTRLDVRDTHERLSNGTTWIPKYKSYLPGVDNDARLSAQQSDFEKLWNPVQRLVSNTAKAPLDIVGSVYGLGAAALSGRFEAIYDNDFMNWLDDATTRTNFNNKNYYNEQERNEGLGLNLQTFDKVLGGAEFTTRLLVAEGLLAVATGGASLPASMAKAGLTGSVKTAAILNQGNKISKALKYIKIPEMNAASKASTAGKSAEWLRNALKAENLAGTVNNTKSAMAKAANRGQLGDFLVKSRFAVTSPLYEAGFESRHFQKEAEENFWNYYREQGREPTDEEINDFSEKLSGAANGVFITNMAILGPSNLAMMGNVLNLSNPFAKAVTSSSKGFSERVLGMGIRETAEGTFQAIKPTLTQKTAAYLTPLVKSALTEGVYEEGGQGIASSTFKNYVASSYDPKYAKNTANYIDAFGQAFSDQFGTKEGREEMIIGAIIGSLFGGVGTLRGASSVANQYKQQQTTADVLNRGRSFADKLGSNDYTNEVLLSLFAQGGRYQHIQDQLAKAQDSGDKLGEAFFQAQSFVSMLDAHHSVGKEEDFLETMRSTIQGLDNMSIAESTGLDINEVGDYKKEVIDNMEKLSKDYSTALKAGRYIFGGNVSGTPEVEVDGKKVKVNGEMLSNALAFSTAMAGFNERFAMQSFDALQTKLAESAGGRDLIDKLGSVMALKTMGQVELDQFYNLNGEISKYKKQINKITDQIVKLEKGEKRENDTAKRIELSEQLQIAQNNLAGVSEKADALFKASVDNFYGKMNKSGYATMPDLENFTQQVNELNNSIDALKLSPGDKLIVTKLFEQFNSANDAHKSFVNMAQNIQDAKFSPKTFKAMFGGLRAKWYEKSVNEHTKDTLAEIFEFSKPAQLAKVRAEKRFGTNIIDEDKLKEDYKPTINDLNTISDKLKGNKSLTETEKQFYEMYKDLIDTYNKKKVEDPLSMEVSPIDEMYMAKVSLETRLNNLMNGEYSEELQKELDDIDAQIKELESQIEAELITQPIEEDSVLTQLDNEIAEMESELEAMETSRANFQERKQRQVVSHKNDYTQYEYVKPNGTVVVGYLEVNKGILQLINEDEIVDIQETNTTLRNIRLNDIKGLTEIAEDDVIIEGKEVYVNGKIYRLGLKNPTLDESISKDKDGNYQVKLQSRNGKLVVLKGSVADAIVYQNLLNKLENDATTERIIELREQAERDAKIERKYEELILKTEDRDSRIQEINRDRENAEQQRLANIEELNKKTDELRASKDDRVLDERMSLEDSIAEMNGEISTQERLDRLREEVARFRQEAAEKYDIEEGTPVENEDTISANNWITKLELEIANIEAQRNEEPFNPNGTPSEQLEWVVTNLQDLNFENVDEAAQFTKPSDEDIQEYKELIDKSNKNAADRKRIGELRTKLAPFIIAEGLSLDGINILELIELYNQSKRVKEKIETQSSEMPEQELQKVVKKVDDKSNLSDQYRADNVGLVYDGAYVKKRNNAYAISHIRLGSMLLSSLESGFTPVVTVYEVDNKGNKSTVGEVPVTFENFDEVGAMFDNKPNVRVQLLPNVWLSKNSTEPSFSLNGSLNEFTDMMDIRAYAITGQPTEYILFYDKKSDGTWGPKEAEYSVVSGGVEILFNKEVLNSIEPGDKVTLEFDPRDEYNQTLTKSRRYDEGNIYVRKNGQLVQILKASNFTKNQNSGATDLQAIRKKVIDNPKTKIEVEVTKSYLGLPIITLDENGTAIQIPVDETNVVAYGYVDEKGDLKGDAASVKVDNDQYVTPLSTTGKKTPVVVFTNHGKNIVFPINLKPKGVDLRSDVDNILSQDVSQQRKMIEINSLLEQHNLLTSENALTTVNFDVEKVKNALEQVYDSIDVTDMNQIKDADKTAFIDLNDGFKSSKLVFDFGNVTESVIESVGKATTEIVKQRLKTKNSKGIIVASNKMC